MSLRSWWRQWRARRRIDKILRQCGCVCYCPRCKEPLNDQADIHDAADDGEVNYRCKACGFWSRWNFAIAPFPVLRSRDVQEKP